MRDVVVDGRGDQHLLAGRDQLGEPLAAARVQLGEDVVQDENGWVELNATADGLTANAIPEGQEGLIVIGEGLEKERIEVRLKG